MVYAALRWVARIALSWFYRDVELLGAERLPRDGPTILAVNHPNQLVDVLLVGTATERRLSFTAKAVLFDNPLLARFLSAMGVVPLRRVSDERARLRAAAAAAGGRRGAPDPARNVEAFRSVVEALRRGGAVLIFPEGISHDRPELAPLKTGVARMALDARAQGVRGPVIAPIGLVFERKWAPRTRVAVQVGEPLDVEAWLATWRPHRAPGGGGMVPAAEREGANVDVGGGPPAGAAVAARAAAVVALTGEVERRLRAVTLNFPSAEAAERVRGVARVLAAVGRGEAPPLARADAPLGDEVELARRVDAARRALEGAAAGGAAADAGGVTAALRGRAEAFLARLDQFSAELDRCGVALHDVGVTTTLRDAVRFTAREAALITLGSLVAAWGRINHWLPIRLARLYAERTSRTPEDPAANTIVAGVAFVLVCYALQTALVWRLAGGWWALAYLASLPPSAGWDFAFRERLARARRRARTYLRFRRDPALRERLLAEAQWLRAEALAIEEEARAEL